MQWVDSTSSTEDLGPGRFSVSDVHRIGILDIVLANTDRHEVGIHFSFFSFSCRLPAAIHLSLALRVTCW